MNLPEQTAVCSAPPNVVTTNSAISSFVISNTTATTVAATYTCNAVDTIPDKCTNSEIVVGNLFLFETKPSKLVSYKEVTCKPQQVLTKLGLFRSRSGNPLTNYDYKVGISCEDCCKVRAMHATYTCIIRISALGCSGVSGTPAATSILAAARSPHSQRTRNSRPSVTTQK